MLEQKRYEHQREHGERAAEDEGRPAAAPRESRKGNKDECSDCDCTAPSEHLRSKPVAAAGEQVELVPIVRERAVELLTGWVVRDRLAHGRQQCERDGTGRDGDCCKRFADAPDVAHVRERPRDQPAAQRDADEERVGRVHERKRGGGDGDRREHAPRRIGDVHEDEREHRGHEQLP